MKLLDFLGQAQLLLPSLITMRRQLHQYPELSWQETKTTEYIAAELRRMGLEVTTWEGETGVLGVLHGGQLGSVVALRSDIDALPIEEQNDLSYRSQHKGVMHACGHDAHITCLLGAASILAKLKQVIKGTVKFIFQPAEESGGGASLMIGRGVLTNPQVKAIFALHSQPALPVGTLGLHEGLVMAFNDPLFITVKGKGGHGAMPHQTRDPIIATASIIQALQTIISRQIDPLASAVISFGTIGGGLASNVIPEKVELSGTVRTTDSSLRKELRHKITSLTTAIAAAMGTEAQVRFEKGYPAVNNPTDLVLFCQRSLSELFNSRNIVKTPPVMVTEDFAEYQEQLPGVLLWLGVGNLAEKITRQLHNPCFDINEKALMYGAAILSQLAYDYLEKN
jgi:amidohydrolase